MTTSDEHKQTLKKAALALLEMQSKLDAVRSQQSNDKVAIIGAACRLPGHIKTLNDYWLALDSGKNCISEVPLERFDINEYFSTDANKPGSIYTKAGGFIDDAEKFDATFFGISPKEAVSMDPQQRVFLEVSWEALEAACIPPSAIQGSKTGIFVGVATHDYLTKELYSGSVSSIDDYSFTGTASSVLAARLAYKLDLHGPCMSIDTACSSSLVAIHEACKSLLSHESNLAIAGGVNLILSPENTVYFCKIHALSIKGICNTFDDSADGYVRSEGCGVIILKRLSDAIKDNDNVLAVINSSAINQDGRSNGLTAPNGIAQEHLIRDAIKNANIDSKNINYVEAHGTGTKLGDPIEVRALSNVYGKERNFDEPLYIGSVKSQIGHLEAAAGVASVIKVCLALQNKKIPGTINIKNLNSNIPWNEIPLKVPVTTIAWPENGNPKVAAVNSFGLSGTNAHIIMESLAPKVQGPNSEIKYHILTISAKSPQALKDYILKYRDFIQDNENINVADICTSSNLCKEHFKFRFAAVADSNSEMLKKINNFLEASVSVDEANKQLKIKASHELLANLSFNDLSAINSADLLKSNADINVYDALATLYTYNENINWKTFHANAVYNKIVLPNYPFQLETYIIEKPKKSSTPNVGPNYDNNLTYTINWEKYAFESTSADSKSNTAVAICCNKDSMLFTKFKTICNNNPNFLLITYGDKFKIIAGNHFELDIASSSMWDDFLNHCKVSLNFNYIQLLYSLEYNHRSSLILGDKYIDDLENFANLLKQARQKNKENNVKCNIGLVVDSLHIINNKMMIDKIPQSSIWGLGKIALLEMPEIFNGMFDLQIDSENFDSQFALLYKIIQSDNAETEIIFREKSIFVPRIYKFSAGDGSYEFHDFQIKSDACYLISGGLGGLGLEIANWLVEQGAKELILISRHTRSDKFSVDVIDNLSKNGAKIHIVNCDITDYVRLKSMFEELNLQNNLSGVIHAAGAYTSETINQLDKSNLQNIINPKLQGLLVLHDLTKHNKLDFFVCFSSIAAVWGAKNYAAYAAANYFMNIFIDYRRQDGLSGISINWGPWDQVGMAMQEKRREQFINGGINPLPPKTALNMLDFAIRLNKNNLIIADIDWQVLIDSFSNFNSGNIFKSLQYNRSSKVEKNKINVNTDNHLIDPNKLKLVMQYIRSEAVKSLNLKSAEMFDLERTFLEQGMDSIAAVHFCRAIGDNLGLDFAIPSQTVFSYPTVEKLAIYLIDQVAINKNSSPKSITAAATADSTINKFEGGNAALTALNKPADDQLPPCIFIHSGLGDTNYALLFLQNVKRPCFGISLIPGSKYVSYQEIVNDYVAMAQSVVKPQGELLLVGYSFGGTIAWGVANQLKKLGYKILKLVLLDAPAMDVKSDNTVTFKNIFDKIPEAIIIDKIIAKDEDYSYYKLNSSELKRLQMIKTVFAEALHSSLNIDKLPVATIHQLYSYSKIAFLAIDQLTELPPYSGKVTMFVPYVSRPIEIDRIKSMCDPAPEIIHVNGDHFNMVYENELHDKMQQILS